MGVGPVAKEVGSNSRGTVRSDSPGYAEWPKGEISEPAEKPHPREGNSNVEGPEDAVAFSAKAVIPKITLVSPIPKLYLVKVLQMKILIITEKRNKKIVDSVKC